MDSEPTGKRLDRPVIFQVTSLLVVHMIIVHNKSSTLSTSDAISDRDPVESVATILATSNATLATTLICSHPWSVDWCLCRAEPSHIDRPPAVLCILGPFLALVVRQECFDVVLILLENSPLHHAVVVVVVGIEALHHVVCDTAHDCVHFEPVVEAVILLFVECADFLVFYCFEL